MEMWGFIEKRKDVPYLSFNTADQFMGRLSLDPTWSQSPMMKSKQMLRGLWEELKVMEGVHGPTAERFDESIDFLLDPEHVQDAKKAHAAAAAPDTPTAGKNVCKHAEPPNKVG